MRLHSTGFTTENQNTGNSTTCAALDLPNIQINLVWSEFIFVFLEYFLTYLKIEEEEKGVLELVEQGKGKQTKRTPYQCQA